MKSVKEAFQKVATWVKMENRGGRITPRGIKVAVLIVVALVSLLFSGKMSSVSTYSHTIETLDEQKSTVTTLLASATSASAVISMLPDDAGTPIADELAELSGYFLAILGVLYTQKYLLTVIGFVVFTFIIPLCAMLKAYNTLHPEADGARQIAKRMLALGLVLFAVTPASTAICREVKKTYQYSIQETVDMVNEMEEASETTEEDGKSIWDKISEAASSVINGVSNSIDWVKTVLNRFVEAIAVELVTSCVIPILVLLCMLGAMKLILGVEVNFRRLGSVMRRNVPAGKTEVLGEK